MSNQFKWHPDDQPPHIELHSEAKLKVLRSYLRAYFDRLNVNPNRDQFRLDLVDGFAGGGIFSKGHEVISGTPLIMLEEANAAKIRLNENRRKPLRVDCKFYFVDEEQAHTDHLRKVLSDRDYNLDEEQIVIQTGLFEKKVSEIIKEIRKRQPQSGRAIFLLDQTGYSQVPLALVSRIFRELRAAEVILTFAVDSLVNFLRNPDDLTQALMRLQLGDDKKRELILSHDGDDSKALAQRILRDHVRQITGSKFDTPFFINPETSRRALWFLHLSNHPTARDVMIKQHWSNFNNCLHFGIGGFGMLGFDAILDKRTIPLFRFNEVDALNLHQQLLEALPEELFGHVSEQPISIDALHHLIANDTAAKFSDLDKIILKLFRENEFEILNSQGKVRSRSSLQHLSPTDQIALPSTLLLPGFSRRSSKK